MFDCWSSSHANEGVPLLYDGLDPLNEQFNDLDRVQLQNPKEFSDIALVTHLSNSEGESEQKCRTLGSSIDVKMENVNLLEVLDHGHGSDVGVTESELKTVGELMETKVVLESLENDGTIKDNIYDKEGDKEEMDIFVNSEIDNWSSSSNESCSDEPGSEASSSIATSLSSSEDEDDCGIRKERIEELEEGELSDFAANEMDFMSDEEGEGPRGPIRSKHEVEDLPPVPKVEVLLQPHHQLLPVGVISSIVSNKVIVEGSIRHNPLDEGSVLWVTHSRLPLGLVDEIFGPVKNPYYVVRYNSEEVPLGIEVGTSISFVSEFASPILNDTELCKKGYDASGDNDEEVGGEVDFSDDEKETEYKKALREGKQAAGGIKGKKQESRFQKKKIAFQGTRSLNKVVGGGDTQQTRAPHSTNLQRGQPVSGQGFRNSSSHAANTDALASRSPPAPAPAPERPQAPQSSTVPLFSNPSQQMFMQHADACLSPGFPSLPPCTGLQVNLPMQFQSQNLLLNNFLNLLAMQQLVSNPGNSLPWLGAAPPLQPMGQNSLASNPFVNVGLMNVPGPPAGQIQSQVPQPFAPLQFNPGNFGGLSFDAGSSGSRGGRPWHRGGGRSFGQGGRRPNW